MGSYRPLFNGFIWKFLIILIIVNSIGIQRKCLAELLQDTDLVFVDVLDDVIDKNRNNSAETTTLTAKHIISSNLKNNGNNKNTNSNNDEIKLPQHKLFIANDDDIVADEKYDNDNDELTIIENQLNQFSNNGEDDDNTDSDDEKQSWLTRGMNRVKREINRMLGGDQNKHIANKKRNKNTKNRNSSKKLQINPKKNSKKLYKIKEESTIKRKTSTYNIDPNFAEFSADSHDKGKRDSFFNWFKTNDNNDDDDNDLSNEGSGIDGDDNDLDSLEVNYYRVVFTTREPWTDGFRERASYDFQRLQNEIKNGFETLFSKLYGTYVDMGFEMEATLVEATPTHDSFQMQLTVDLKVKGGVDSNELSDGIENELNLMRLGSVLVVKDENYLFTKISEHMFDDPSSIVHHHDYDQGEPHHTTTCEHDEFQCPDDKSCIALSSKCDNFNDCPGGQDEENCQDHLYPTDNGNYGGIDSTSTSRSTDVEASGDYETVTISNTDSHVATRCDETYVCQISGKQICHIQLCDGVEDCPHGEDENENQCNARECRNDEFTCADTKTCIPLSNQCNGYPDCPDYSDEQNCNGSPTAECSAEEILCDQGTKCYHHSQRCDGRTDCRDGADELNCALSIECEHDEFKCENGKQCISRSDLCDGYPQCQDESDERNCQLSDCRSDQYQCKSGQCILRSQICDNNLDCRDGDDEETCHWKPTITPEDCGTEEFYCDQNCVSILYRCDGVYQCMDKRDEANCHFINSTTTQSTNDVPTRYPCPELSCTNNGKCYRHSEKCDGTPDCDDGSDERNCCESHQFQCPNGVCAQKCDGRPECPENEDEEGCPYYGCHSYQWRCDNGQCINSHARCDGSHDCDDYSDERGCPHAQPSDPQLNLKTYPSNQIIKESREVVFRCRDEGPSRAQVRWSRPGGRPLPRGFTDKRGRLEIPNIRVEDSGEYVCEAVGYPAFTRGQSISVSLTVERYNPILDRPPSACGYHEATCMNGECIDKNKICDGIPHCSDGSDEQSCSHGRKCSPNQFRCKNSRCIDRVWRCDGENDCFDNSDEESCDPNPSNSPCRSDEFQCRSGHCVPKTFHCDGTNDCRDGTDEVGCVPPSVISPPPPRVDLYPGSALNISCRAVGVPTPLIIWRLNWGHVPEKCESTNQNGYGTLYCPNMQTADSGAYSCEIINIKGGIFVTPDTIVTVIGDTGPVCPAGTFNNQAVRKDECISCFCFGIANQCRSAELFIYALPPPITSHKVVGVQSGPFGVQFGDYEGHNLITTRHGVQFRVSDVPFSPRQIPYLELPSDYSGNQLKSYGGFIKYTLSYFGHGRPVNAPDVIMVGNGYSLSHRSLQPPISNGQTQYNVQFAEGQWEKPDGRLATRSELMMVLADVEKILIRLEYIDALEREVELTHITLDSAGANDRGLGSASLVEECTCPTGYMGYSCERCAPGYVRQKIGPWLGRCVPYELPICQPGYYGDPSRGIECKQCPCPLTNPTNNFATGCTMGHDSEPICNCHIGYIGHRCQECAPGYEGNPMQPGGYCRPRPTSQCNSEGTLQVASNGTCICKSSVIGSRCDMCAPNSFHLNSYSFTGCIECFCSSVTSSCSSSNYYRDTIHSSFSNSRGEHGFTLVNDYENDGAQTFSITEVNDQLVSRGAFETSEVLYWSLPSKFLGDKVTAYGGLFNYTVRFNPQPGGLRSRNVAPDVVIRSKHDIVILHYNKGEVSPSIAYTYAIPIVESSWQRHDGVPVDRPHLLMALADIEAIYIKATYTTVTQEAALISVSMDTAGRSNTGKARAVEVEQCICPPGYTGLSCEDCAPGYKRSSEEGLYLGVCELCECNGHSSECDAETGNCLNCLDNTEGSQCERCIHGFEGNATIGTPHDCRPIGDGHSLCDLCDHRGVSSCDNQYCHCKANVIGERCDRCRLGTFNLNILNPYGCEECFCSGVTSTCAQANFFKELIPLDFITNKPIIADQEGMLLDEENLQFDINRNLYTYLTPSYTQKYWSLSGRLLEDQVKSYGGNLEFKLDVESSGQFEPGKDIILMGNGVTIYWSRPSGGENLKNFTVRLHSDNHWYRQDAYSSPYPASKIDIMTVLANIDHILIRATPSIPAMRSSLSDVILESANTFGNSKVPIEFCTCPEGYEGSSCENCAPLHYRNISQTDRSNFGACMSCQNWCSEHTDSCKLIGEDYVQCICKSGYSGDRCQYSDHPIYPTTPSPRPATIEVRIDSPTLSIIPVGGSLTLTCSAIMLAANRLPVSLKWSKLDDNLPYDAEQNEGVLRLYNLQVYDSGVYVCQARSGSEIAEEQIPINVGHPEVVPEAPTIHLRPSNNIDVEEQNTVEVICEASGTPTPNVEWEKTDGQISSNVQIYNERLYIASAHKSDEGAYRCTAYNDYGRSNEVLQIFVRFRYPPSPPVVSTTYRPYPEPAPHDIVVIEPPSYNAQVGERVRLLCELRQRFIVEYEWLKDEHKLLWSQNVDINGNELIIRNAHEQDTGNYICKVTDQQTGNIYTSSSYVHVQDDSYRPENEEIYIKPLQEKYTVIQGQDLDITCEASGSSRPTIKWTRLHEQLDASTHIRGSVLSIKNAQPHHRGLYICMAEAPNGATTESHTVIDVEPRERPQVDIYPSEPQEVRLGDSAIMDCRAVAGIPEPTIVWRRTDGRPLPPQTKQEYQGRIMIENIKKEDAGIYECIAENLAGKSTGSTSINIVEPPKISLIPNTTDIQLTEGEDLRLVCISSGIPSPKVSWSSDKTSDIYNSRSEDFKLSEAEIYIARTSLNDAKLYKCEAQSSAGTDIRYVNVRIEKRRGDTGIHEIDPPTTERLPRPTYAPPHTSITTYPVQLGERATLSCSTVDQYNREVDMRWSRVDGKPIPTNSIINGRDLILYDINYDTVGVYRCNILGHQGNTISYLDVNVIFIDLPHITLSPEMPMTVRLGETVEVYCNVTGAQPIGIEWHAESRRPMPPSVQADGPYLRFNSIQFSDAGRYYCSAANHLGNATKVAEVIVNRGETIHDRPPTHITRHEIYEGQDVNLNCDYSAQPGLRFLWKKANGFLPQSAYENNNILILRQVSGYDEGRYICQVLSPENSVITETSVELIVNPSRPDNVHTLPILKLDQQEAHLKIGESTEVECQSFDKRYPDVIWERADGRPLPRNVRQIGNKLIAQNVDLNSAGSYVCKCKTDEGDLYTTSFELNIEEDELRPRNRPRTEHVKVGSDAHLNCETKNYPSTYRWSRQHGQIQHGKNLHLMQLDLHNVQAADAGTYVCTVTHNDESIDQPIILVVTGSLPQFDQAPKSFMVFPTLESPYMKFYFEITFKPTAPNGLILYNGQRKGSGDFISLILNDRYPEFRFDFGNKPTIVRAEKPITLNEWHTIKVSRIRRDGYLIVDEQAPIAFPPAQATGLDLVEDLYIGGVPKWEELAPNATHTNEGFVGCISQLVLQNRPIELIKEAKYMEGISSYQPCADKPCQNSGICLESQTSTGYLCVCDDGFTGKNCAIIGDKCAPGICGRGRCQDTDFGIECSCPLNRTGDRCQYNEHLDGKSLAFKDGSYAAYKTPRPSKLNIKFNIKATSLEDSVILYVAESERANGDFFAVLIKNKKIELRINCGARVKPVIVTSQNELELNKWTDIEVGRRVGEGILKVGNELEQTGKQAGPARSLYLKTHLFIGGYDKRIFLNRDIDVHRGLDGCISNLEESGRKISLIADLLDAANIQNCADSNDVLYQKPPHIHNTKPTATNDNYEMHNGDPCANDPCENYGTCVVKESTAYKCNCPLGYSGNNCHEHVQLDHNCQFNGDGYLELNKSVFNENDRQIETFIAILFSTKSPNGLLVWWGQPKNEQYDGQDFIALAINEGILEFSFRLDGEENSVQSAYTKVDDGARHIAIIKRIGNEVSLELDHLIEHGETKRPTVRNEMILPGNVFIGGAPNLSEFTGKRYPNGFKGCVRVIEASEGGPVHLGQHAISGLNTDVCPSDDLDEDLEGPEPPIV